MNVIDIFNRALGLIGHDREIPSDDDQSSTPTTEYVRCSREWDGSRISVLAAHPWTFLTEETPITVGAITTADVSNELEYEYERPTDQIRLLAVKDPRNRKIEYRVSGGRIFCKCPEIKIEYLLDSTDPDEWPPYIADAVAAELSSRITLAMTANPKMVEAVKLLAAKYLSDAKLIDSSEKETSGSEGNRYIKARR